MALDGGQLLAQVVLEAIRGQRTELLEQGVLLPQAGCRARIAGQHTVATSREAGVVSGGAVKVQSGERADRQQQQCNDFDGEAVHGFALQWAG
jgi:hypothetical protein